MRSFKIPAGIMLTMLAFTGLAVKLPLAASSSSGSASAYVEDLLLSFEQNFSALAFNATAIQQCGDDGSGPFYSVVGLSNSGYWYEFGIAWNWPTSLNPISASHGFQAIYDVYGTNGRVFRASNQLTNVGDGDITSLKLSFANGLVTMQVHDWNSSATDQESYSAFGATEFVGEPTTLTDPNGYFTGLRTQMYHNQPYYGDEQAVTYKQSVPISSAWMRIVEFPLPSKSPVVFDSYGSYSYNNTSGLQNFTSNGAFVASDAYEFVTGQLATGSGCTIQGASSLLSFLPRYWFLIPIVVLGILVSAIVIWLRRRPSETVFPSPLPQGTNPSLP